ncbi:MAG TPA: DUF805 domain-containing protein [Xanthomonadaceae bacterium]
MDWMLMPLKRYADFNGRSRRKEYWMFTLLNFIVGVVLYALMFMGMDYETGQPGTLGMLAMGLLGIYFLAILIPSIAVQVRRFHDQEKSGWFVLLGLIPFVGGLIVIVFMCLEGTRGPNRFGEDPKAGG